MFYLYKCLFSSYELFPNKHLKWMLQDDNYIMCYEPAN